VRVKVLQILLVLALSLAFVAPVSAAPPACGTPTWHTVARGETLFSIGRLYGVSPWAIASANGLANPNRIYAGQCLWIPAGGSCYPQPQPGGCGSYYIVQHGDTLFRIAHRYGVSAWSIARANGLYNMNVIRAGQRLYIPCY
jgi:LysM repeat protein